MAEACRFEQGGLQRRAVTLALLVVTLVGGTVAARGAGAAPSAPPAVPTCVPAAAPAVVGAARDRVVSTVAGCTSISGLTGYRVSAQPVGSAAPPAQADTGVLQGGVEVAGLSAGTVYAMRVAARNADGAGTPGPASAPVPVPFVSATAMADRQFPDFAGRAATATERTDWTNRMGAGTLTPVAAVDGLQSAAYWQVQSPVIRLFQAYFLRLPDLGGLNYWVGKSRAGTSLGTISQSFASSAEFKTRYGSLTNKAFVELVYQNVLGRPGEAAGVAYWTGELDAGRKNRGQVMAGFSESTEYKNKTRGVVDTVNVFTGMLRRVPTATEVNTWKTQARTALILSLLGSVEYETRVKVVAPPFVTTPSLPGGAEGVGYPATTMTAVGGKAPLSWSVASGTLPDGLTLSSSGVLSGSPATAGSYSVTIRVTDAAGKTGNRPYTVAVAAFAITTASLPAGTVGVPYSTTLATVHGKAPITWFATGELPSGLTLSEGGVLSGTPTAAGTTTVEVQAADDEGRSVTRSWSLAIAQPVNPVVTTTSLWEATMDSPYEDTLAATGGTTPYTWSISAGALPAGLTLSTAGVISGTPTGVGTANFTVKVTDKNAKFDTKALSIVVQPPWNPTITTTSLANAQQAVAYSKTLQVVGGQSPYAWSLQEGSTLPGGLSLSGAGVLSGTPTVNGMFTFTVEVTDANSYVDMQELTLVIAPPVNPVITTAALPGGQQGVGYAASLDATGGTKPYTWSIVSGSLPAGVTLSAAYGLLSGTPTGTGTASVTIKVTDSTAKTTQKAFTIGVTTPSDWPMAGRDAGRRSFSPGETAITSAAAPGLGQEWSRPGSGEMVAAGGVLYRTPSTYLEAVDIATGQQLWRLDAPLGDVFSNPVLTAGAVLVTGADGVVAFDRGGTHARLWATGDEDPGVDVGGGTLVFGSSVITWGGQAVTAYSLADGTRQWQSIHPSGQGLPRFVAAGGSRVVVTYDDRVRALNSVTGAQAWSVNVATSRALVADPWVYLTDQGTVRRHALADGAAGWTVAVPDDGVWAQGVYAVDADRIYVWEASFAEGEVETSRLRARRASDGASQWETFTTTRMWSVVVAGDVVWVAESSYFSGAYARVAAHDRATGALRWERPYAHVLTDPPVAVHGRLVVSDYEGQVNTTRAYGLAAPFPVLPAQAMGAGRVGTAYSQALSAQQGTPPYTWSVVSGSPPAGLSLSGAGTVAGTPSAAGTTSFTVRVTDSRGRTATRVITIQVNGAGSMSWTAAGSSGARNPVNPYETVIGVDAMPSVAARWRTAVAGGDVVAGSYRWRDALVVGNRLYAVQQDGVLYAWDTTGTTTNRAPLWSRPSPGTSFQGDVVESGGTLYLQDQQELVAVRASDGVVLWHVDVGGTWNDSAPVVVGSIVAVVTNQEVRAYSTSDGTPAWGGIGAPAYDSSTPTALASDGTRIFFQSGCRVRAISAATGSLLWTSSVWRDPGEECNPFGITNGSPVVSGGVVYASSFQNTVALNAATGALVWRADLGMLRGATVANGLLIGQMSIAYGEGGGRGIGALDLATGDLVWEAFDSYWTGRPTVVGDLAVGWAYDRLLGVDTRTGDKVWDSGLINPTFQMAGSPAILGGRIYALTLDQGVRTFAPPG